MRVFPVVKIVEVTVTNVVNRKYPLTLAPKVAAFCHLHVRVGKRATEASTHKLFLLFGAGLIGLMVVAGTTYMGASPSWR